MNAICTNDHGFCIVYNGEGTFPKFHSTLIKIANVPPPKNIHIGIICVFSSHFQHKKKY